MISESIGGHSKNRRGSRHRVSLSMVVCGFLALPCCPAASSARDLFVNNATGDDLFNGRIAQVVGSDGPVRSIAKALRICEAGDRIVIANAGIPYRESVSLIGARHSGFPEQPFVLEGNGALLDGRVSVPADAWQAERGDIFRLQPPRLSHLQLYLGDRPARYCPIKPGSGHRAPRPLEWTLSDGYIRFRVEPGKLIDAYPLSITYLPVGISIYATHDLVVRNLIVQGYQLDGIHAADQVNRCRLESVTARGNGRCGIVVSGASQVIIERSSLSGNVLAQLMTEDWSHTAVFEAGLLPSVAPAYLRRGGELLIDHKLVGAGTNESP